MTLWKNTAVVMIGSGLGGGLRFLTYAAFSRLVPFSRFPFGTLTVNVVGSFLITFISHVALTTTLCARVPSILEG